METYNIDQQKHQLIVKQLQPVTSKRILIGGISSKYMDMQKSTFQNLIQKSSKKKKILQIQQQQQQSEKQEITLQLYQKTAKTPAFKQVPQFFNYEDIQFYNQMQKSVSNIQTKPQKADKNFSQRFNQVRDFQHFIDHDIQNNQHTFSCRIIRRKQNDSKQISVSFPFKPYDIQLNYISELMSAIENKENALLESPTGTGKTLCLFTGVLAWYYQSRNQIPQTDRPKIIYLSRTHTQIRQAQKQLKKTCYRPSTAVLGSRDQLCVKEEYDQFKGNQKNDKCSQSRRFARKNPNTLNQEQKKKVCNYYCTNREDTRYFEKKCKNKVMDIEDLKSICIQNNLCPYYFGKRTVELADVVFMPYNYLLSQQLLQKNIGLIKNSILLFDQAHNVADKACSGKDSIINSRILKQAVLQAKGFQKVKQFATTDLLNISEGLRLSQQVTMQLKEIQAEFQSFYDRRYQIDYNFRGSVDEKITEVIRQNMFLKVMHQMFMRNQKRISNQIQDAQRKQLNGFIQPLVNKIGRCVEFINLAGTTNSSNLQKVGFFFAKLLNLIKDPLKKQWEDIQANHYRMFINRKPLNQKDFEIQLKCMTPSLLFQDICMMQPRSIILTSGTLSPLISCEKQLKVPFKWQLLNSHVINPKQLELHIIKNITAFPEQIKLNFSFNSTADFEKASKLYKCLAQKIADLCKVIPGGILIVFPSYRILTNFERQMKAGKLEKQIQKYKKIYNEGQKNIGDVNEFIADFKSTASKRGAVLLCVCRGKVSEGIDLSDQLCRGVIFIGVPYAAFKDPFVQQKKSYLNTLCKKYNNGKKGLHQYSISGHQWYQQEATRAVNQALGRVIRHKDDYGMIFLMDQRYTQAKLKKALPGWSVQSQIEVNEIGDSVKKAAQFFQKWEHSQLKGKRVEQLVNLQDKKVIDAFKFIMPSFKKENKRKIIYQGEKNTTSETQVKNQTKQEQNKKLKCPFQIIMQTQKNKQKKKL